MDCPTCGGPLTARVVRARPVVVLAALGLAYALIVVLTGALLHDVAEGMERTQLPLWKLWLPLGALLVAVSLVASYRRRPVCAVCGPGRWLVAEPDGPTRRSFLRSSGAAVVTTVGGVAAAIAPNRGWLPVARDFVLTRVEKTAPVQKPEWAKARIRSYRRLGRTDVKVSDISLGGGGINDVEVARAALERGITYFDTSPDYSDTLSEHVLGEAIRGHRSEVFLATKFCRPHGHLANDTPVPEIMTAVEDSLRRLQTDHVDLVHIHSCDRVDRLLAPNIHEAFDRLKEQGKVRFLGVSTHTPNLEAVANAAIDSGRFDVMMLAYHFGMWNSFADILAKAHEHDVGVVAMKTLKGAKHTNLARFRDESTSYAQAAFRWVLANPAVSCLVVTFTELRHVDEYVAASGTVPHPDDTALLERYDELTRGDYCQPGCGECLDRCPVGLPINDVLRYRMYFRDYGREKAAVEKYARLTRDGRDANACLTCPAPCAGSCPIGVPIREKMLDADAVLRLRA